MTLKEYYKKYDKQINRLIADALSEDKISQDVTTSLILNPESGSKKTKAVLLCKEDCILAGIEIFKRVYRKVDPKIKFKGFYKDGDRVRNKSKVMTVESTLINLLHGERTALNFLQRMSGIATLTNKFVKKLKFKDSHILHTRKTTPNFRIFEIAAFKTGGGDFHRTDLSSAVMIKDNHIEANENINNVLNLLNKMRAKIKKNPALSQRLEIEVKNMDEVQTVANYRKGIVKIVMLDNFKPKQIDSAVHILKPLGFKIEISGGVNEHNFSSYQRKGVDYYSIGMLTHSYKSTDFSLDF